MKVYLVSFGAGLLVGVVYSLLNVRSPAPPVVALIGLLGILLGEQIIPMGHQMIAGTSIRTAWQQMRCGQHVFGAMPGRHAERPASTTIADAREVRS
jgi:XapX domain-containing protein